MIKERRRLSGYNMAMWIMIALIVVSADFTSDQMIAEKISNLERVMLDTNKHICEAIQALKD